MKIDTTSGEETDEAEPEMKEDPAPVVGSKRKRAPESLAVVEEEPPTAEDKPLSKDFEVFLQ